LGEVAYLGARLLVGLRVQGKFQKELVLLRGQPDPKRSCRVEIIITQVADVDPLD
jgi:hypothetical protein